MNSTAFAVFLVLTTVGASATPLQEFFERIQDEPFTLYQCYRNAATIEPDTARDLRITFARIATNYFDSVVDFSVPGEEGRTSFRSMTQYLPDEDVATLQNNKITELIKLLPTPYQGEEAYYFKQIVTGTGQESFKIFDTSDTCENAAALHQFLCTDPCDLENVQ